MKRINKLFLTLSLLFTSVSFLSACQSSSNKVSDTINSLTNLSSGSTSGEVSKTRKLYDSLSEEEKQLIPSDLLEKLVSYEAIIKAQKEAEVVINKIKLINNNTSLDELNAILDEYKALSEEAKKYVTDIDTVLIAIQKKNNEIAINEFSNYILNIDLDTLTFDKIDEVTGKYIDFDDSLKDKLSQEVMTKYQNILDYSYQIYANQFAAEVTEIDLTKLNIQIVIEIKNHYASLNEKSKTLVNVETMDKYNQILAYQREYALEMNTKISDIFTNDALTYVLTKRQYLSEMENIYSKLDYEYQKLVTNYSSFEKLYNNMDSGVINLFETVGTGIANRGDAKEYVYSLENNKITDSTYGDVYEIKLNPGNGTYNTLTMYLTKEITKDYYENMDALVFYVYSPQDAQVSLVLGNTPWQQMGEKDKNVSKGWNKIIITKAQLTKPKITCFTCATWASFPVTVSEGWKLSPIYGIKDMTIFEMNK